MKPRRDYAALVAEYEASGLTQADFCRSRKVNLHTFKWRLGQARKVKNAPRFVPLSVAPPAITPSNEVEIRYQDGTVLAIRGADMCMIRELLPVFRS
jgi:hypothetical protein